MHPEQRRNWQSETDQYIKDIQYTNKPPKLLISPVGAKEEELHEALEALGYRPFHDAGQIAVLQPDVPRLLKELNHKGLISEDFSASIARDLPPPAKGRSY